MAALRSLKDERKPVRKRVYLCARCGKSFKPGEDRLHSDWSGNSYCIGIDACEARAKRYLGREPIIWRSTERR